MLCQKQAEPSGDTFDQLFTTKRCGLGGAGGDMRALEDSGPDGVKGPGGADGGRKPFCCIGRQQV